LGPHGERVDASDAGRVLADLCDVLDWYLDRYASQKGTATAEDGSSPGSGPPSEVTADSATRAGPSPEHDQGVQEPLRKGRLEVRLAWDDSQCVNLLATAVCHE